MTAPVRKGLLLDFGGVISVTLFERHALSEETLSLAAEIQQQSLAPRRRHCAGLIRVFSNAAPIASTICVASWRESTNGGERMMMLLEVRIIAPAS